MKYDLQRLGGAGFQDVVSALAIKVLGAHVRPMGRGRDGGRDMLINNGVVVWTANDLYRELKQWDGTTVFQVKHKETLEGPQKDAGTLWQNVKDELDKWASPDSQRGAVPHYLVFATNIPLTPVHKGGGFDTINANIQNFLDDLKNEHPRTTSTERKGRALGNCDMRAATGCGTCAPGVSGTVINSPGCSTRMREYAGRSTASSPSRTCWPTSRCCPRT